MHIACTSRSDARTHVHTNCVTHPQQPPDSPAAALTARQYLNCCVVHPKWKEIAVRGCLAVVCENRVTQ